MKCKRIISLLLALCLMLGVMVIPAKAVEVTDGKVNAVNYYTASGISTNGHYIAKGIFVQEDGDAYIILALDKNDTVKEVKDVAIEVNGLTTHVTDPDVTFVTNTPTLTVLLPGGSSNNATSSSNTFLLVRLGQLHDIATLFFMSLTTSAGGWDMKGMEVRVNLNYEITKEVNKSTVDPGEAVQYTVTITNTGDNAISNISVYDDVPEYLEVTGVGEENSELKYEDGRLLLDCNLLLPAGANRTYTVYATVSTEAPGMTVITNTATIESMTLIPAKAQATVTVNPYFFVYHQATGKTDRIMMHQLNDPANPVFNITQPLNNEDAYAGVTTEHLYGGIYENKDFVTPITNECGVELVPENNRTYFMKEVPNYYLQPKIYSVYDNRSNPAKQLRQIYLVTAIDNEKYQYVGFDVVVSDLNSMTEAVSGNVYQEVKVYRRTSWTDSTLILMDTLTAKGIFSGIKTGTVPYNDGLLNCQLYLNYPTTGTFPKNYEYTMRPFFVTPDGVKVTGAMERKVNTGAGYIGNYDDDGLTTVDTSVTSQTSRYTAPANALMRAVVCTITDAPEVPQVPNEFNVSLVNKKSGACKMSVDLSGTPFESVYVAYTFRGKTYRVEAKKDEKTGLYTASIRLSGICNKEEFQVSLCCVTAEGYEVSGETISYMLHGNRLVCR